MKTIQRLLISLVLSLAIVGSTEAQTATPPLTPSPVYGVNNPVNPVILTDPYSVTDTAGEEGYQSVRSGYDNFIAICRGSSSTNTRLSFRINSGNWQWPTGNCSGTGQSAYMNPGTLLRSDVIEILVPPDSGLTTIATYSRDIRISIDGRYQNSGYLLNATAYMHGSQRLIVYIWYWPGSLSVVCSSGGASALLNYSGVLLTNVNCGTAATDSSGTANTYRAHAYGTYVTPVARTYQITAATITPIPDITPTVIPEEVFPPTDYQYGFEHFWQFFSTVFLLLFMSLVTGNEDEAKFRPFWWRISYLWLFMYFMFILFNVPWSYGQVMFALWIILSISLHFRWFFDFVGRTFGKK